MEPLTKQSTRFRARSFTHTRRRNDTAASILRAQVAALEAGAQARLRGISRERTRLQSELTDLTLVSSGQEVMSRTVTPEVDHPVTLALPASRMTSRLSRDDSCLVLAPGVARPHSYSPPRFPRSNHRRGSRASRSFSGQSCPSRPSEASGATSKSHLSTKSKTSAAERVKATNQSKSRKASVTNKASAPATPPSPPPPQRPARRPYVDGLNALAWRSDGVEAAAAGDVSMTVLTSSLARSRADIENFPPNCNDEDSRPSTKISRRSSLSLTRSKTIPAFGLKNQGQTHLDRKCRFSIPLPKECPHFPCSKPMTYHSINFRRDDLVPWVVDKKSGNIEGYGDPNQQTPIIKPYPDVQRENITLTNPFLSQPRSGVQNSISNPANPQPKREIHREATFERENPLSPVERHVRIFPPVTGPYFSPVPCDPILEHIRRGGPRPPDSCLTSVKARSSVRDKLRGLRHLVHEMRARNESSRPRDWTVNYGARVPDRVLLNPVLAGVRRAVGWPGGDTTRVQHWMSSWCGGYDVKEGDMTSLWSAGDACDVLN